MAYATSTHAVPTKVSTDIPTSFKVAGRLVAAIKTKRESITTNCTAAILSVNDGSTIILFCGNRANEHHCAAQDHRQRNVSRIQTQYEIAMMRMASDSFQMLTTMVTVEKWRLGDRSIKNI